MPAGDCLGNVQGILLKKRRLGPILEGALDFVGSCGQVIKGLECVVDLVQVRILRFWLVEEDFTVIELLDLVEGRVKLLSKFKSISGEVVGIL